MRVRRIVFFVLAGLLLAVGGCVAVVSTTTRYDERPLAYTGRKGEQVPPAWTLPCRRVDRRYRRAYVLPCGRVQGIVLYREDHDPDGDDDIHVVVAARRVVIVKSDRSRGVNGGLPGTGRRVDLAGTVTKGRFGVPVVDVRRGPARSARP